VTEVQQNPIDQLKQADDIFRSVLQNVTPDQMGLPTVNDEWDVRALINHVVNGNMWAAENVRHGSAPRPSGDVVGDRNPMEAYSPSAEAMIAAFAEPGALGRTMALPFGEMPAAGFAGFRFVDLLSHAWDLAKATGQDADFAPELCEAALAISRRRLNGRDRAPTPFKDEVHVPEDACAADRLAGYLGKRV
jgi:uncharacterized protein (TIGR03086 family)